MVELFFRPVCYYQVAIMSLREVLPAERRGSDVAIYAIEQCYYDPRLGFVNPNPGEVEDLPKTARRKMVDKPARHTAGKP